MVPSNRISLLSFLGWFSASMLAGERVILISNQVNHPKLDSNHQTALVFLKQKHVVNESCNTNPEPMTSTLVCVRGQSLPKPIAILEKAEKHSHVGEGVANSPVTVKADRWHGVVIPKHHPVESVECVDDGFFHVWPFLITSASKHFPVPSSLPPPPSPSLALNRPKQISVAIRNNQEQVVQKQDKLSLNLSTFTDLSDL